VALHSLKVSRLSKTGFGADDVYEGLLFFLRPPRKVRQEVENEGIFRERGRNPRRILDFGFWIAGVGAWERKWRR
jgi:hypothetical protein